MNSFFDVVAHNFQIPLQNPVLSFALVLFIILLSPIILRKLHIPGIIGLIISGVIIGPFGLHIIEKDAAVSLFSTIGLLYIMFIAGLELDLNEFRKYRNKSFLFGFFTFTIPLLIGFPICYYVLDFGFLPSLLTASMFSTHTLVAYPIVIKLGVSKNQAVAVTVGGTILTDTTVLILFAIILGWFKGELTNDFWLRLIVSVIVFTVFMFAVVPRISRWFFQKLESEKHSHYIFVLAVVFLSAFLAQVSGLEPIIGAFVAGLALNRLIPQSSALMNRIEFIGNSLFIPIFLISVGMVVDISVITKGYNAIYVAAVLTIVALIGKWVAAYVAQKVFHYSRAQRGLIFGLSSSHAAATLAIILIGYQEGILNESILNGTIILILITCIVASFSTEKAAKTIVISGDNEIDISDSDVSNDEHILIPIANLMNLDKLLDFSMMIKSKKSLNPITFLSIVPNDVEAETNILKAKKKLDAFISQASASEVKVNVLASIDHNIASGIARTSREIMSDIIILGWPQKHGVFDRLIDGVLYNTDKTVFVGYFEKPLVSLKRIVVICPPLAELENGYNLWFLRISKLAQELSVVMHMYCNDKTRESCQNNLSKKSQGLIISYQKYNDWDDLATLGADISSDDLMVFISARQGSVSYQRFMESVPLKLEKHFGLNSKIVIYPKRNDFTNVYDKYEDMEPAPFVKGFETIQKLGKDFGDIFKKTDDNSSEDA